MPLTHPRLLSKTVPILALGIHDALSARLAQEAGAHALWLSGFGLAAAAGVPDAGILPVSHLLEQARRIRWATNLPIICDADDGFGNAHNVIELVRHLAEIGIDAICLEDKAFPKVNSFEPGRQAQVSIAEFVGKLSAALHACGPDGPAIIARTESLVSGAGLTDAIRRARAYRTAGADAICVQSASTSPAEITGFLRAWNRACPVVVIPTTYPAISADALAELGASIVIYANHGIRAAAAAEFEVFRSIISARASAAVESKIASVNRIFEIQDMTTFRRNERLYVERACDGRAFGVGRLRGLTEGALEFGHGNLTALSRAIKSQLKTEGAALIRDVPASPERVVDVLQHLGPLRPHYGLDDSEVHPLLNRVRYRAGDAKSLHGSGGELTVHSARCWARERPAWFAMFMANPGCRGFSYGQNGESRLTWWRDAVSTLRASASIDFDRCFALLHDTPLRFEANNVRESVSELPLLYDIDGAMDTWDVGARLKVDLLDKLPRCATQLGAQLPEYTQAVRGLIEAANRADVRVEFVLERGDLVVVDNHRVGHGRCRTVPVVQTDDGAIVNPREVWSAVVG